MAATHVDKSSVSDVREISNPCYSCCESLIYLKDILFWCQRNFKPMFQISCCESYINPLYLYHTITIGQLDIEYKNLLACSDVIISMQP